MKVNGKEIGTVRWFDPAKGYGFIKPINKEPDIFLHVKKLAKIKLHTLSRSAIEKLTLKYTAKTDPNNRRLAVALGVLSRIFW